MTTTRAISTRTASAMYPLPNTTSWMNSCNDSTKLDMAVSPLRVIPAHAGVTNGLREDDRRCTLDGLRHEMADDGIVRASPTNIQRYPYVIHKLASYGSGHTRDARIVTTGMAPVPPGIGNDTAAPQPGTVGPRNRSSCRRRYGRQILQYR